MNTQISNYEQQATNFLNATSTAFTCKFKEYGKHFANDKESRDIFTCTLKNKLHTFRFKFGQSLVNSTGNGDNLPTAYDVLACLTKYDPGTFDEFCSEYGYNTDSRQAFKTYKAGVREWKNMEKLFSPEQSEALQEIN